MNYRLLIKPTEPPTDLKNLPWNFSEWWRTDHRSLLQILEQLDEVREFYYNMDYPYKNIKPWDEYIQILEYDDCGKLMRIVSTDEINKLLMLL